jgi:hypothetical protein
MEGRYIKRYRALPVLKSGFRKLTNNILCRVFSKNNFEGNERSSLSINIHKSAEPLSAKNSILFSKRK